MTSTYMGFPDWHWSSRTLPEFLRCIQLYSQYTKSYHLKIWPWKHGFKFCVLPVDSITVVPQVSLWGLKKDGCVSLCPINIRNTYFELLMPLLAAITGFAIYIQLDGWRYNTVLYNMILHTSLLWLRQNIYWSFNPHKTCSNRQAKPGVVCCVCLGENGLAHYHTEL